MLYLPIILILMLLKLAPDVTACVTSQTCPIVARGLTISHVSCMATHLALVRQSSGANYGKYNVGKYSIIFSTDLMNHVVCHGESLSALKNNTFSGTFENFVLLIYAYTQNEKPAFTYNTFLRCFLFIQDGSVL